jgi:hypothetical protein
MLAVSNAFLLTGATDKMPSMFISLADNHALSTTADVFHKGILFTIVLCLTKLLLARHFSV